ncbi:hypothetical protein C0V72_14210 [Porphyrobacter sp. TH134]|uniref:EAL domain-containing protein n=1 Tax=Porphyrobacter sp. TH134 TaxID=2067450 RepID=UPI000C7A02A4|nr:EAL domain-containing protein [Porphyrobacter sp. TH134]PLK22573.1 hypothetical protein C0V72_14210 [Porphyrobacter sp. TH134]
MQPTSDLSARPDTGRTIVVMVLVLAIVIALVAATGMFRSAEHRLEEWSFALTSREASGQVQVVEMDAASMAAIRRWPWSRDHHARVVRVLDAAGARSISFDVDFSSGAGAKGDRALADAIAAARASVALPTFAQNAGSADSRQLDTLPIAVLREQAHLASVSVAPDGDGYVRRMPLGTITSDTARPSLSAFVAGRSGATGQDFPVDYAIDPATIPRHSFIAIENGRLPAGGVAGKDIIIGATAVELGDRYAVPRNGVIPGVIIQALAAETLAAGVPIYGSWVAPLMLAALLAMTVLAAQRRRAVLMRTATTLAVLLAAWLAFRLLGHIWFEIVPALLLAGLAGALRYAILTRRFAMRLRQVDEESGLLNRLALDVRPSNSADSFTVAAQIDDFGALQLAIADGNFGALVQRIAERLQVATGGACVYRTQERTLAWVSTLPINEIESQLAGIRALMRSPFDVAGRRLGVSLTFGVADHALPDAAARAAHAATEAHRAGKFWRLHSAEASEAVTQQLSLLGELDDALRSGNIAVLYQPKLNLATRQIDAVEALVRWNHPERGLLPPDCFIPLFEERNRIDDLTLAVLERALDDMKAWWARGLAIGVAVNVSAALLTSEGFVTRALALVARSGAQAQRITFEVTESAQFDDTDAAIATLLRFRGAGIRISMDDYGTGQSALNYLKLLPLSELKIDRMFVSQAHVDKGDAMLVRSTVQLAHELGIQVVAEGIEDAECLAFLERIGCDYAQGFFIGRPLACDALADLAAMPFAPPLAAPIAAPRAA